MATLASMTVRLGIDTAPLRVGAERAKKTLAGLGKAVGAVGVGAPAIAAVAAAAGGLAAAFASAGAGVGAFGLAAKSQMKGVSDVAALAADASAAAASGAADAAEKQKAYTDALKRLPPATQATATAFVGLQGAFKKWSDGLSGSTMPVFTKGIQILRSLLPSLTPLVQATARAFSSFLDGLKGNQGSISGFIQSLAGAAEKNLGAFLRSIRNVAVGAAGIIRAFMGISTDMSGGVEKATAAFAKFGQSLSGSAGFAQFIALAKQGGSTLATLGKAAVQLLVALGPLVGITANIATGLAKMISALPPGVLAVLASLITIIVVAMKLWGIYSAIATTATEMWAAAQAILDSALLASPITWIVLAIVALIAIIVLVATKTNFFQTIWSTVWNAIKTATSAVVSGIKAALNWFAGLGAMFAGWFNAAKNAVVHAFTATVNWVKGVPEKIGNALLTLTALMMGVAIRAGTSFVNGIKNKGNSAISFVKSIPGKAKSALGSLGGMLVGAGKSLIQGFINGIKRMFGAVKSTLGGLTHSLTSWKGPESLDKKILTPNGKMVIGGFMRGIQNSVPALRRQLGGVTNDLSNMAVGVTPSGVFRTNNRSQTKVTLDVTGADSDMKKLIRRMVRTDGRGSVQTAFGQ